MRLPREPRQALLRASIEDWPGRGSSLKRRSHQSESVIMFLATVSKPKQLLYLSFIHLLRAQSLILAMSLAN